MAPSPRDTDAGLFHVYTHCVWAAPAHFRDDLDRLGFLRHLARTTAQTGWTCLAFCLMTTHYHLIVDVADGVLPRAMHRLNLGYVRDYNRRHGMRGHAQAARYAAKRIRDESHLLTAYAYVVNNPVSSGDVEAAAEWAWSSFAATIGLTEPHSFVDDSLLTACFGGPAEAARARLRAFVEKS